MSINNDIDQHQVCFCANLSADTGAVTGDGTSYTLICDTVILDNAASYNNGSGVFTVPVTGNYLVGYNVNYLAIAAGAQEFYTAISYNGASYGYVTWPTSNKLANFYGPNSAVSSGTNIVIPMTAGLTASIVVVGTNGAKNDKIAGLSGSNIPTMFYCYLLN